jgi:hypothetical protein
MHQHRSNHSDHTASAPLPLPTAPCDSGRAPTIDPPRRTGSLRRLLCVGLLLVAATAEVGCAVPIYSSSRDERARQLIYVSEGLRHIPEIWERIWGLDMPDTATPYRVHGGVI